MIAQMPHKLYYPAPLTDQVQMFNSHLANYTGPSGDVQVRLYYLGLDYAGSILIVGLHMF